MTGQQEAITIDVPRRTKRENRRQRRRRKFGNKDGEDVRRFWIGACDCEECKGRSWPHIYVSVVTRTTARRYGMRPKVLAVGWMSFECHLENNHLLIGLYPDVITSNTGTTTSESAAAIAAAQRSGVKIVSKRVQQNADDLAESRRAREMARRGEDVMLTASEMKRRGAQ